MDDAAANAATRSGAARTRGVAATAKGTTARAANRLEKAASGIHGLDTITFGGLPRGRPTLVCGSAGCGKTLLGMQFLLHGATIGEPGVAVTFEETEDDLVKNVASLGVDLRALIRQKRIAVDHVHVDRSEILETGGYDLSGLFVRLEHAINSVGAKRIVLDTLEVLFAGFTNTAVMRSELERLFRWLKEKGITALVTGERGEASLTRSGLEEYVSDCVIVLDQRLSDQIATRRLRVVKYRGSSHGTNEYPFLIGNDGISRVADHRARARLSGVDGAGSHRHLRTRRDVRRKRVLPREQRAHLGNGGHRQEQRRRRLQQGGMPSGRARPLLRARRAGGAGHAQHEIHRLRPWPLRRQGDDAHRRREAHHLRSRAAPREHARRDREASLRAR